MSPAPAQVLQQLKDKKSYTSLTGLLIVLNATFNPQFSNFYISQITDHLLLITDY